MNEKLDPSVCRCLHFNALISEQVVVLIDANSFSQIQGEMELNALLRVVARVLFRMLSPDVLGFYFILFFYFYFLFLYNCSALCVRALARALTEENRWMSGPSEPL